MATILVVDDDERSECAGPVLLIVTQYIARNHLDDRDDLDLNCIFHAGSTPV